MSPHHVLSPIRCTPSFQVMVRDRRRPRKSIKEMSVLNKRRRVIKNTARKEIAQQKATLESMRHIGWRLNELNSTFLSELNFNLMPLIKIDYHCIRIHLSECAEVLQYSKLNIILLHSLLTAELKRYSLEARELELFVERVQKVKENKRLTMLFAKFKVDNFAVKSF